MNIVILSDIKYKEYADLYIEGIQRFLKRNDKIIYFTIGFKYNHTRKNVITHQIHLIKKYPSIHFYKPLVFLLSLKYYPSDYYFHSDIDLVFSSRFNLNKFKFDEEYPVGTFGPFEFPFKWKSYNHNPDFFIIFDEKFLMKKLGVDSPSQRYVCAGIIAFNKKCENFIKEWHDTISNDLYLKYRNDYFPYPEETALNVLLWKYKVDKNLGFCYLNTINKNNIRFCENNFLNNHYFGGINNFGEDFEWVSDTKNLISYHGMKDKFLIKDIMKILNRNRNNLKIVQVTPGLLPIPPNGWGAIEKIIWDYKNNLELQGHTCDIKFLDDVDPNEYDIIHIHAGNLCNIAHERGIPYYFTCHDHHTYLYGKESPIFQVNHLAMKNSIKSFVPAKYLVDYFDLPNVEYFGHGVNNDFFTPSYEQFKQHKLLCVANNGYANNLTYDRKGFSLAINAAKKLDLPITIAGPTKNNKSFFEKNNFNYDKLDVIYDLDEKQLLETYQSHTIFLHLSELEAGHPNLTLLEALSCGLPVIGTYENNNQLKGMYIINRDVDETVNAIDHVIKNYDEFRNNALESASENSYKQKVIEYIKTIYKDTMKDKLIDLYENTEFKKQDFLEHSDNAINVNFHDGPFVEITGDFNYEYKIKFIDDDNRSDIVHECDLKNNMWTKCNRKWYTNWKVSVFNTTLNREYAFYFKLKNKNVKIINDSSSLGDYISIMPCVEEFRKKHNCSVDFYTPHKELFQNSYKDIKFFDYNHFDSGKEYYITYKLGFFDVDDRAAAPIDWRTLGLQQTNANILGLSFETEIKPIVAIKSGKKPNLGKYVCISTSSTAGCKHWQNKTGWQNTVNYLHKLGYKVVVIQKESLDYMDLQGLKNVIHPKTKTFEDVITWLSNCEFYIGLGSGISWLSWALNKKVIMISGFSKPFAEFSNPYRVINENVCNGCWNDTNFRFDPSDWNWCPRNKSFECTKQISFEMVKEKIDQCINDIK